MSHGVDYIIRDLDQLAASLPGWPSDCTATTALGVGGATIIKRTGWITYQIVAQSEELAEIEGQVVDLLKSLAQDVVTGDNQHATVGERGYSWLFVRP